MEDGLEISLHNMGKCMHVGIDLSKLVEDGFELHAGKMAL